MNLKSEIVATLCTLVVGLIHVPVSQGQGATLSADEVQCSATESVKWNTTADAGEFTCFGANAVFVANGSQLSVALADEDGSTPGEVTIELSRFSRCTSIPAGELSLSSTAGCVIGQGDSVSQWLEARPGGVKQWLYIPAPPLPAERSDSILSIDFLLRGASHCEVDRLGNIRIEAGKSVAYYSDLVVYDASWRPVPSRLSVAIASITIEVDDSSCTYPIYVDPFLQINLVEFAPAAGPGSSAGDSVAMAGSELLVGAPGVAVAGGGQGAVYVCEKLAGIWSVKDTLLPPVLPNPIPAGTQIPKLLGRAMAVDGSLMAVGAPGSFVQGSTAMVGVAAFERASGVWSTSGTTFLLPAVSAGFTGKMGESVSVNQGRILVGAPNSVCCGWNTVGSAYLFEYSGGAWSLAETFVDPNMAQGNRFGAAVRLWSNLAFVGASGSSKVHVFESGALGTWSLTQTITAPTTAAGASFGAALELDGSGRLFVGAPGYNSLAGSVFVYAIDGGGAFVLENELVAGIPQTQRFGSAVSYGDGWLLVGAPRFNGSFSGSGTAYLFASRLDQLPYFGRVNFDAQTSLNDFAGTSVLVRDGILVVGAPEGEVTGGMSVDQGTVHIGSDYCGVTSYCTAGTSAAGCIGDLSTTGIPSASASSGFSIIASGVEGAKQGLIFYGIGGAALSPWGNGFLCVKLPTQRMSTLTSSGMAGACDGVMSEDWNAFMAANLAALGSPRAVGDQIDAQCWYRDPASQKTTAMTDAIMFVICP